jgi:hypothetical protein
MENIIINQPPLRYQWIARYSDGTFLEQNYLKEDEHNFGHIDQERLVSIDLVDEYGNIPFSVNIKNQMLFVNGMFFHVKLTEKNDCRVIYFRRIRQNVYGNNDTFVFQALGLQSTENGKNYQLIMLINELDNTVQFVQKK